MSLLGERCSLALAYPFNRDGLVFLWFHGQRRREGTHSLREHAGSLRNGECRMYDKRVHTFGFGLCSLMDKAGMRVRTRGGSMPVA